MGWTCSFGVLVLIFSLVSASTRASFEEDDFLNCEHTVRSWAESSVDNGMKDDKLNLKDLLFFLHVPRTGGRTYFYCFLRKLYNSSQECPRSYDKLRFDPSKPNCRLMVTHDDYSLVTKLPKERTSVVTVLRNPIDRIFSTYEFSVEVAARFLVHPNLTSATEMSGRVRPKYKGVSTLDIWPWKYLVPWMREDLFARRDARKLGGLPVIQDVDDPYNMGEMVMPLHEYINDPLAHEIIHNGATFQVAGLTNNSYIAESHEVRHCVRKHPELGHFVLEIAKNRLNGMLYVGLTEDHKKSATMFASMVGAQVLSQSEALSSHFEQAASKTESNSSDFEGARSNLIQHSTNGQQEGGVPSPTDVETKNENMTVGKLMDAYEECVSSLRKSQSSRRNLSLKRIAPANFTKKARLRVPKTILQQILSLNSLDVELYKHAQSIFMEQKKHIVQNAEDVSVQEQKHLLHEVERLNVCSYWCSLGKVSLLAAVILIIVVLVSMTVATSKRTSKIKV